MADDRKSPLAACGAPASAGQSQVDVFLERMKKVSSTRGGRLLFALDATMSRQGTWDMASQLQAEMFREVAAVGGLNVQLVYYRGFNECRASRWLSQPGEVLRLMEKLECRAGHTQIRKILAHAKRETEQHKVQALIFVGDAVEQDGDNPDVLAGYAAELGRLGVPVFMFQEGDDPIVERVFREVARLSNGAYCRFDPGAAHQLGALLRAAAVFVTGGKAALIGRKDAASVKLLTQLKA